MPVQMKRLLTGLAVTACALVMPGSAGAELSWRASAPVALTAAARPIVLGGLSRSGWPAVLVISPDTKRLRGAVIALEMSCTSGGSFTVRDAFQGVPIGRKGKVHVARAILPEGGSTVSITGGSHALNGTFNRSRMTFSGWWHLHLDFQTSSGQTDHCDSGRVRFAAA